MSKKPVSLEAQLAGQMAPPPATETRTENVVAFQSAPAKPALEKATVYLPKAAMKRIKQMALDHDKRINDLLQEGVELMLARYGQPTLKEFDGK
ncbi:hypothetical protein SAMN05421890_4911 [Ensifer adhaerens]|nr:hypothetical protein SAMN05421890_4911 [Ensifer adhaerens]